jgi:hypothetical protein
LFVFYAEVQLIFAQQRKVMQGEGRTTLFPAQFIVIKNYRYLCAMYLFAGHVSPPSTQGIAVLR